jgi:hypothetical protein
MKLNLGCGHNHMDGFLNVDKEVESTPDKQADLEVFPWPFEDNAADEVVMSHVLEHLGADPQVFLGIMKELYRVCANDALVTITVPHPRHDTYLADPTHVRPILPQMLNLFSKAMNLEWKKTGVANTTFALYLGVDFNLEKLDLTLDDMIQQQMNDGHLTQEDLNVLMKTHNNIVQTQTMVSLPARLLEVGACPRCLTILSLDSFLVGCRD